MAIEASIKCDICGRAKGETNNWPRVREDANSFRILKPHVKVKKGDKDICGAVCLHTMVDRFLDRARIAALESVPSSETVIELVVG